MPLNSLHILEECNIPAIRCSQDKHKIDKYGNRLLDLCRSLELFFVNGRVGTDCGITLERLKAVEGLGFAPRSKKQKLNFSEIKCLWYQVRTLIT
jgi:hypothetical protein